MRGLSAADILNVWERGAGHSAALRGLDILAVACTGLEVDALAELTVGQRDALLLEVRQLTLGSRLEATTRCPACDELLEFAVQTDDLRLPDHVPPDWTPGLAPDRGATGRLRSRLRRPTTGRTPGLAPDHRPAGRLRSRLRHPPSPAATPPAAGTSACIWEGDGVRVTYRLPRVSDLIAIGDPSASGAMLSVLLERCVLRAEADSATVPVAALRADIVEALAAEMARRDPQADLQLALTCPACGHSWQAPFDIASFFWAEIAAAAKRLLREVHLLARAYGWREADILAMSASRRQAYIEMIQG